MHDLEGLLPGMLRRHTVDATLRSMAHDLGYYTLGPTLPGGTAWRCTCGFETGTGTLATLSSERHTAASASGLASTATIPSLALPPEMPSSTQRAAHWASARWSARPSPWRHAHPYLSNPKAARRNVLARRWSKRRSYLAATPWSGDSQPGDQEALTLEGDGFETTCALLSTQVTV